MQQIDNFKQANKVLSGYTAHSKLGGYKLDFMRQLMNILDNPQNKLRIIHVAGTSGKTSTSYYIAALLHASGQKVGLTVSPHVEEVNERIQIDMIPLPEAIFCQELSKFLDIIDKNLLKLSYFELMIAFAFWEFYRQKVDYAVIEVGLGGLLDCTNVIDREDKVCVITDIGLDHIDVLGNTLTEIAGQKAGIINKNNVAFCNQQEKVVLDTFRAYANKQDATLNIINSKPIIQFIKHLPLFQKRNFHLAKAVADYILARDSHPPLLPQAIKSASEVSIPARMEVVRYKDKTIIMDGAHNAQKIRALIESIMTDFPNQKVASLVSFTDGRSYRLENSLHELSTLSDSLIVTKFYRGQDLPKGPVDPEELTNIARHYGFSVIEIVPDPKEAFTQLLIQSEPILLITGSFFLMDTIRPLVKKL